MKAEELRDKSSSELKEKISDLQKELVQERGQIAIGGFADNPGRLGQMKKDIARIKTVLNEQDNQ